MELSAQTLDLALRTPFRISRGVQEVAHNVVAQIEAGDLHGIGEGAPSAYYGERCETVLVAFSYFTDVLGDDPTRIEEIHQRLDAALGGNTAAKAAIDMALYDLLGKRLGAPVYQLLGLNPAATPRTSFTIGLDTPEEMARRAAAATGWPVLKIKLGTPRDLEIVRAIRGVSSATLRVDANGGWQPREALRVIEQLAAYDIEFVEQPVPAHDLAGLRFVRERSPLPIIADESCVTLTDIPRVAACADGINVKLMKCGGIGPALKMIATARAHGLRVMLGCMVESSLACTAAAQISPLVDYADLDGPVLIANDPYDGVQYDAGKLVLPDRSGLGVRRRGTLADAVGESGIRASGKRGLRAATTGERE